FPSKGSSIEPSLGISFFIYWWSVDRGRVEHAQVSADQLLVERHLDLHPVGLLGLHADALHAHAHVTTADQTRPDERIPARGGHETRRRSSVHQERGLAADELQVARRSALRGGIVDAVHDEHLV